MHAQLSPPAHNKAAHGQMQEDRMPLPTSTPLKLVLIAGLSASTVACSSGPQRRGGPPPGGTGERGGAMTGVNGKFARPVALLFAGMDIDRDMVVTRAETDMVIRTEWRGIAGEDFSTGPIALADWLETALGTPDAQPSTVAFDNNFDGVISMSEFESRLTAEFDRLDTDKDGSLTRAELVIDLASLRETRSRATEMRPEGGGGRSRGGRGS